MTIVATTLLVLCVVAIAIIALAVQADQRRAACFAANNRTTVLLGNLTVVVSLENALFVESIAFQQVKVAVEARVQSAVQT